MAKQPAGRAGGIGSPDRRRRENRPTAPEGSNATRSYAIAGNRSFDLAVGPRR
jgi:hypothetical protein